MYEDKDRVHSVDNQSVLFAISECDIRGIRANVAVVLTKTLGVSHLQW